MSAAKTATTYDLMVLLDPERPAQEREALLAQTKRLIEGEGALVRHDPWGLRELAYPIKHHRHAEYHLLQLRPAQTTLLAELDRTLRISDTVLRYRIVKLPPSLAAQPPAEEALTPLAAAQGEPPPAPPPPPDAEEVDGKEGRGNQAEPPPAIREEPEAR